MPAIERKSLLDILVRLAAREPSGKGRISLPVAWASTRGASRQDNQDRLIVGLGPSGVAFAVLADGMGGLKDGARAATLAVAATAAHCAVNAGLALDRLLDGALRFANDEIFRLLRGDGGATIVAAAWMDGACYIAHAGDARGYCITAIDSPRIKQLTVDDTLDAQLAKMGRRYESEPELHRGLVQFIGVGADLEPHVARVPDGSRGLLLTTDGVHSIPATVLEWIVRGAEQLQSLPERLVLASEWQGGRDNGTAIVLGFQGGSPGELIGAADFWVAGERVAVPATISPQTPAARLEPKFSEPQVEHRAPGRPTRGKRSGGGGRKASKSRTREAKPREDGPEGAGLPLVDFNVPPKENVAAPVRSPSPVPEPPTSPASDTGTKADVPIANPSEPVPKPEDKP
jgi:serine/threonine protein phosphatase PrpC